MAAKENHKHKVIKWLLIGLAVILLLFSIISIIVVKLLYDDNFDRAERRDPKYSAFLSYEDATGYERTRVEFPSGKNTLVGYIYGQQNTKGLVVISHGLGGTAEGYLPEALNFVDNGWRVLSFNNTGVDESEGKNSVGLAQSVIDLDAALTYIENDKELENLPVMLYGHSWGGYAVTAVLNYDHKVSAAVSLAGYNSPNELLMEQSVGMMGSFAYVEAPFLLGYQRILFGKTAGMTAVDGINKANIPVMIIHGDADTVIHYDGAGIMAHRNEITDPYAIFITGSAKGHTGHNGLSASDTALAYIDEVNAAYEKLYNQYDGKIPDDVRADYYAGLDKVRVNELDPAFMERVNSFYEASIK